MLKRETRILGLSGARVGDAFILVGVIFRGSLWLDGIVTARIPASPQSYTVEIGSMVRTSRQFSQLHAIIVSSLFMLRGKLHILELSRSIGLPVIAVTRPRGALNPNQRLRGSDAFTVVMNRTRRVITFAGASKEQAEQLYLIASTPGSILPEPVRVADLLAKQFRHRKPRG